METQFQSSSRIKKILRHSHDIERPTLLLLGIENLTLFKTLFKIAVQCLHISTHFVSIESCTMLHFMHSYVH